MILIGQRKLVLIRKESKQGGLGLGNKLVKALQGFFYTGFSTLDCITLVIRLSVSQPSGAGRASILWRFIFCI